MHSWKAKGNANLLTKDMMAYGNTEDLLISFKFHKVHSLQTWFQFATRKHHCVLTNNRAPCFLYYVKKQSSTSLALDAFYSGPHHMAICMLPPWSLSSTLLQCQYYKICTQMFTFGCSQSVHAKPWHTLRGFSNLTSRWMWDNVHLMGTMASFSNPREW